MAAGHTSTAAQRLRSANTEQVLASYAGVRYTDTAEEAGKPGKREQATSLTEGPPPKASCRQIFHAMWRMFPPYFCNRRSRWKAWPLLMVMMIFMFVEVHLTLEMTDKQKDIMNALHNMDRDGFYAGIKGSIFVMLMLLPAVFLFHGATFALQLDMRKFLTEKVLDDYVSENQCYYRLKLEYGNVDNPDQRIAQDIGGFAQESVELTTKVIHAVVNVVAYSTKLCTISPTLFYVALASSAVYTLLSATLFAGPLMRIKRRIFAVEGDLRYVLVRVREHAESIAFFRGHGYERVCSEKVLDRVIWSHYKAGFIAVAYHLFTGIVQRAVGVLPKLLTAPSYFEKQMSFGSMEQSLSLFDKIIHSLMDLGKHLNTFATFGANAVRVQELWDALEKIHKGKLPRDDESTDDEGASLDTSSDLESSEEGEIHSTVSVVELEADEPVRLELVGVTLYPPLSSRPLFTQLSATVREGESLLIEGTSGTGKSSLLRAIAGLWGRGAGTIHRTRMERCFFLPQTPYLCLGSLRDNVLYPRSKEEVDIPYERISQALGSLGIPYLLDRYGLDTDRDFAQMLSGGERQRLNFARLLLRDDVALALLDEATSALDDTNERLAYQLLKQKVGCYISVGHKPALVECHTKRLCLSRPSMQK